jgi:DNA-3-methyladenine glycosylase I
MLGQTDPVHHGVVQMTKKRCTWAGSDPLYVKYHDLEWGVPVHRDRKLFEMLTLEGAQAGLSWLTILRKRENYRRAFDRFDPQKVARYDRRKVESLMQDAGIVRNRAKIESTVANAKAFLAIREEFGTFNRFVWQFVDGEPKINRRRGMKQLPAKTDESTAMSRELRKRGMNFVGPTICYAFMQAVGMVNDHVTGCFRYNELVEK